jgi:hypothetical protein
VLDVELAVATAHEAFDDDALADRELADALHEVVAELVDLAEQRSENRRLAA